MAVCTADFVQRAPSAECFRIKAKFGGKFRSQAANARGCRFAKLDVQTLCEISLFRFLKRVRIE
jgi:hypothetical protein